MRCLLGGLCVLMGSCFAVCAESFAAPVAKYCIMQESCVEEDWPNEEYGDFLSRCMRYQRDLQPLKKVRSSWGSSHVVVKKEGRRGRLY